MIWIRRNKMQPPVKLRRNDKILRIYFSYNTDLIEVMRDFDGWWNPKEKYWQFPVNKFQDIYDELKNRMYKVDLQTVKF